VVYHRNFGIEFVTASDTKCKLNINIPFSMYTKYGWLRQMQRSQNWHSFHCAWYTPTIHLFSNVQVFMDVPMCQTVKKLTFQNNTVPPSSGSRSWITLALLVPEDDGNVSSKHR